jgi:hypothetical protein
MRIAQLAPLVEAVPPKLYGGTERVVSWLTEELVEMGHEVTLFASGDSQLKVDDTRMGGPFWNGGVPTRGKRSSSKEPGSRVLVIPMVLGMLKAIKPNYELIDRQLRGEDPIDLRDLQPPIVLIPIEHGSIREGFPTTNKGISSQGRCRCVGNRAGFLRYVR